MPQNPTTPLSPPPSPQDLADLPVLRLRIDGGNAEERYDFHFELSRAGNVRLSMSDRMTKRKVPEKISRVEPAEVDALLRALDPAKLKQVQAKQVRRKPQPIPPCSLIGKLEVWDGRSFMVATFMADPAQAEHAGHRVPAEVLEASEAIFSLAARIAEVQGAAELRPDFQIKGEK